MRKELGRWFEPQRLDLLDEDAIFAAFRDIGERHGGFGRPLVNNAGTCFMNEYLAISPDVLDWQIAWNFSAGVPLLPSGRAADAQASGRQEDHQHVVQRGL